MIKDIINDAEQRMKKAIEHLKQDLASLRAGRANPAMLDKVMVNYYGTPTPINQLANITVPEARLLVIQPWDKSVIPEIEKAIMKSDLGVTPTNDGNVVRVAIPQLTEERRKELVKVAKKRAEDAKVAVRNIRREANDEIKGKEKEKLVSEDEAKKAVDDIQKLTDKYVKEIDLILQAKEKDIMEV
ncbi:ribosome recycling factor [Thermosyntropha lipolytica DSM 11003]|uniref:Ribosome-recycling factor n=1 Tax=Thermosyntropha lipolytica DSM 11003 TaxID=1123382 RepID=A0A1M5KWK0_9FIRM|nr:ribosome recycling factor [Thermosyntropha lipolytica]SHG57242.1 ribosome recycling factor [Thermosyntropha lipolytica DSM 11003]